MKRVVSGVSIFLLLMMIMVSVFNLQVRVNSGETTPKYGGTLRIGEARSKPSTLNPLLETYFTYRSSPLFNCLLTYDENCSLQSDLAQGYETSEDGLDVTFHLFENVSWHDGVEFNASDVKFTFDTIRDDPKVVSDYRDYCTADINSTEVVSSFTVVIHLYEPLAAILHYLSYVPIIPRHIYEGTDLATNPANQNPIGTGPFTFESWTPKINLTVISNEQYFRGRPYLDSIFYRWGFTSSIELTAALENNIVDVVGGGLAGGGDVDLSQMQVLQNTPGASVAAREAVQYKSIWLNMSNPTLQSRNVRQAIAHAINRTKITQEALYGFATPAKGPLPPSLKEWYNPDVTDYELNKTVAEELLDQEYPRAPDGWRFSLVIKTLSPSPWTANVLNMMKDDLISVGINASIEVAPVSEFASGNYDAFLEGWVFGVLGPDDLYDIFHSANHFNIGYSNSTLDALLEEGRSSFNETVRKIDFDLAQEIIAQDLPQIFLYHPYIAVAYNNDFHGRFLSTPPMNGWLTPYFLANFWYDPTLSGEGNCPYRVCFIDSEGRRTGYHGEAAYEDIPNSAYSGMESDPQLVKIREPTGIYTVELFGIENSSYEFEFANMALDYKDVSIPEGFIHEDETITYIVKVYGDGSIKVYDEDEYSPHDLGMRSMSVSKTVVCQGYTASLNVTVFNWGGYAEHFNITFYANTTIIGTIADVDLLSGEPVTKSFTWDTSGFARGNYTISASASQVSGEIDTTDNTYTGGAVIISMQGDVNADSIVDIFDITTVALAFNSNPSNTNWNNIADINNDYLVDIFDIVIVALHFGEIG